MRMKIRVELALEVSRDWSPCAKDETKRSQVLAVGRQLQQARKNGRYDGSVSDVESVDGINKGGQVETGEEVRGDAKSKRMHETDRCRKGVEDR